jgi:predicted RNA binding protein YcfA (HicA-like mRNA interferase family)
MTDKQLQKIAKINGWIKQRNGAKHQLWAHPSGKIIVLPYRPKEHTAVLLSKKLAAVQ